MIHTDISFTEIKRYTALFIYLLSVLFSDIVVVSHTCRVLVLSCLAELEMFMFPKENKTVTQNRITITKNLIKILKFKFRLSNSSHSSHGANLRSLFRSM